MEIEQLDVDKAYITFSGTSSSNIASYTDYNIITGNGGGVVDGPKTKIFAFDGWNYAFMAKIEVYTGSTQLCGGNTWIQSWRYDEV